MKSETKTEVCAFQRSNKDCFNELPVIFNYDHWNNLLHTIIHTFQGSKLEAASQVPMEPKKVEKLGVKFMTTFKVMVVKTKFTVAKYN